MRRVCSICEGVLDVSRPWQESLDGTAAHTDCLDAKMNDDKGDDDDD